MWLSLALFFAAAMAFTYVGYPAIAFLLSHLAGKGVKKAGILPALTVILPVHDEKETLPRKLDNLLQQGYPRDRLEIIVVDDGSAVGPREVLPARHLQAASIISLPRRRGKACALNAGLQAARGEVVIFTDARQELAPGSLSALASNFADPRVSAVTGRLEGADGSAAADGFFRTCEERLRSWEAAWGSCAGAAGALYAVRRSAVSRIPPETILDDLVMSISAAARGRLVYEPAAVAIERGEIAAKTWNRRMRTLAGNWQLLLHPVTYRAVLSPRTIVQFFCHKVLRLFFPFFLAGFLFCAAAFEPRLGISLLAAAAAFVAVGALASRRARGWLPAQIAASLVVAPLGALFRYLFGRETVLWARL